MGCVASRVRDTCSGDSRPGRAETCPGAAEHLELRLSFLLPGLSTLSPAPPLPVQLWRRGPDKAVSRRSPPDPVLARGLTHAGLPPPRPARPRPCLDLRIANRDWGRISNCAPPCTPRQAAVWTLKRNNDVDERGFCEPDPVLRFDRPSQPSAGTPAFSSENRSDLLQNTPPPLPRPLSRLFPEGNVSCCSSPRVPCLRSCP